VATSSAIRSDSVLLILSRVALLVLLNSLVSAFRFSGLSSSLRLLGDGSHSGVALDSTLMLFELLGVFGCKLDIDPFFFGVIGLRSAANMTACAQPPSGPHLSSKNSCVSSYTCFDIGLLRSRPGKDGCRAAMAATWVSMGIRDSCHQRHRYVRYIPDPST